MYELVDQKNDLTYVLKKLKNDGHNVVMKSSA